MNTFVVCAVMTNRATKTAMLVCVQLLLIQAVSYAQKGNNERLWFEYPAAQWRSQALHIGNGYMGGSFYGGVKEERFDVAEKTMWTGGPGAVSGNAGVSGKEGAEYRYGIVPGGRLHVEQIRNAIVSGDVAKADLLVRRHFMGDYSAFGGFTMIGNLYFTFAEHDGAVSDYRRELDLSRSVARVSYAMDSVRYEREYFCSYPDRVMVMHFSSDTPKRVSFAMRHDLRHKASDVSIDGSELVVTGKIDGNNREYRVRIRVVPSGGQVEAVGKTITVTGADSVTVVYAAASEYRPVPPLYRGADPDAITSDQIDKAAGMSYEQLKARHIKDYRELYDRVKLTLAGDPIAERLPTNQRWQNLRDGKTSDTGLKVLLFNLGRCLLISASRPGTLPSTLQGVWNAMPVAHWQGNYQSNINLQEMYWPCGPTNLPECQEAYVDWIAGLVIPGREVAQAYYGTDGWVSHTTGNIWGYTAPGAGILWGMYPVGAAWHCQHLWDHYAFSLDKQFLRDKAYPVMKEAAAFWLANLVAYQGGLISAPTVSAEHGVQEKDGKFIDPTVSAETRPKDGSTVRYNIPGAYQDVEMIHGLLTDVMEAADTLGVDKEFRDRVARTREQLLPLAIGKHGQLQEWYLDIDSPKDHHRHISHLWALHPGRQIHPLTTPKLAEAAKTSLNLRGDGHFGPTWVYSGGNWARTWRIWCWVRLLEGDRANKIFTEMVTEVGYENLMTHQSGRMQVDGSMSTPGFMAEMLLQSHLGEIHLLPALPAQWPDGNVRGLIARGAYRVDLDWKDGHLARATIESLAGGGIPKVRVEGTSVDLKTDSRIRFLDRHSGQRRHACPVLTNIRQKNTTALR